MMHFVVPPADALGFVAPVQVYVFVVIGGDGTKYHASSYAALRTQLLRGHQEVSVKLGMDLLSEDAWAEVVPPAAEAAAATAEGNARPLPLNLAVTYHDAGVLSCCWGFVWGDLWRTPAS